MCVSLSDGRKVESGRVRPICGFIATGGGKLKATSVQIDDNLLGRIDHLAHALSRSRSWVIEKAIAKFLEYEEWYIREVKDGLKEVAQGDIATDEEVAERFQKWGVDAG